MTTVRARRYPQPPPAAEVLAGARCGHGELEDRCALCRVAAKPADDQDAPAPTTPHVTDDGDHYESESAAGRPPATTPQLDRPPAVDHDDQDPRSTPWWTW